MSDIGVAYADIRANFGPLDRDLERVRSTVLGVLRSLERESKVTISARFDDQGVAPRIERLAAAVEALDKKRVNVSTDADTTRTQEKLGAVKRSADKLDNDRVTVKTDADVGATLGKLASVTVKVGLIAAAATAAATVASAAIGGFAVKSIAQLEQVKVSFGGILGGDAASASFVKELQNFAAVTPFEFDQLTSSAQRLLGTFGKDFQTQIIPTLTTIGNVTAALGAQPAAIDRVVTALAQIQGKGRVAAEELMQIREALPGFNALDAIAKAMGVTVPQAMKLMEQGAVPASVGIKAILDGMKEFPGAAGAMERQSVTLNGRISTLKDSVKILANEGFQTLATSVGTAVDQIAKSVGSAGLLDIVKGLSDSLAGIVSTVAPSLLQMVEPLATLFETVLTPVGPILSSLLPAIANILPAVSGLAEAFGAIAIVFTDSVLVPGLDGLRTILEGLTTVLQAVGPEAGAVALGMAAMGKAISAGGFGPYIAGIEAFALVLGAAQENERLTEVATRSATKALVDNTEKILASADARKRLAADSKAVTGQLLQESILAGFGKDADKAQQSLGALGLTIQELPRLLLAIREKGQLSKEDFIAAGAEGAFDAITSKIPLTGKALDALFRGLEDNGSKLAHVFEDPSKNLETQLIDIGRSFGLAREDALALYNAVNDNSGAVNALQFISDNINRIDFQKVTRGALDALAATDDASRIAVASAEAQFGVVGGVFTSNEQAASVYEAAVTKMGAAHVDAGEKAVVAARDFDAIREAIAKIETPAQRVEGALKRLKAKMDELSGKKIDLSQAKADLEALLDSPIFKMGTGDEQISIGTFGFNLDIEQGRKNFEDLKAAATDAATVATASFAADGNASTAMEGYTSAIDRARQKFIEAGGTAEAFDGELQNLGLLADSGLTFNVGLDQAGVEELRAEVAKLASVDPKIQAVVSTAVDQAQYDQARTYLDGLAKLDPAEQKVFLNDADRVGTEQALKLLSNAEYIANVEARSDPNNPKNIKEDLDSQLYDILVHAAEVDGVPITDFLAKGNWTFVPKAVDTQTTDIVARLFSGQWNFIPKATGTQTTDIIQRLFSGQWNFTPVAVATNTRDIGDKLANGYSFPARPVVDAGAVQAQLNNHSFTVSVAAKLGAIFGIPHEYGGFESRFRRFRDGGVSDMPEGAPISLTTSHYAPGTDGPRYMYGEPSTHGEYFLSMHPNARERNVALTERAIRQMGAEQDIIAALSAGSGSRSGGTVVVDLSPMVARLEALERALTTLPPITVVATGGSPSNAAAKMWHAQKARMRQGDR